MKSYGTYGDEDCRTLLDKRNRTAVEEEHSHGERSDYRIADRRNAGTSGDSAGRTHSRDAGWSRIVRDVPRCDRESAGPAERPRDGLEPRPRVGLAYRGPLHYEIAAHRREIDVLEVLADHYAFGPDDQLAPVDELAQTFPIVLHGLGLSIGTAGPLDLAYVDCIRRLARRLDARAYSEHLSFTRAGGMETGALLPIPRTRAALTVVSENVVRVQDRLGKQLLLENVAAYFDYADAEMSEPEFVSALVARTGCGLLLDVHNVYVNATNFGFDPYAYLRELPAGAVRQMHIAGGEDVGGIYVDSHATPVCDTVWTLCAVALERQSPDCIVLEWDQNLPTFDVILGELAIARRLRDRSAA